jgi:hypothetical protein
MSPGAWPAGVVPAAVPYAARAGRPLVIPVQVMRPCPPLRPTALMGGP